MVMSVRVFDYLEYRVMGFPIQWPLSEDPPETSRKAPLTPKAYKICHFLICRHWFDGCHLQ